uniref:RRM domain-containing protein n=1 Tax=Paramoeba aestuarina TaxID=180227 RepID=A0A7S4KNK3_9EUKA
MPAPLPIPPAKLSQGLADQLMACENRASQQVDYSAASKRITKSPLDQIVTMGPKNAPTAGFTTQTVLSSYSFNLQSQDGSMATPESGKPNLSFPPLVVMEISPSTLYFLDTRSTPNDAILPTAVSDFLSALPQVTVYTLKLIASGPEKRLNELQIAVLHCTFIVNPSKGPPPGVNEQLLRQQSQQFASTSPYNAPSPYHVIQFRSLISNVTYIPLPEYLFDIHTNSFGKQNSTPSVPAPSSYNGYYSANSGMNIQINANAPPAYIKHSSLSLFIGQTTYRTTPSVLHHIFNVICNIEIVEVEVMRKQPCAFFYVYLKSEEELRQCIEKLHKKILFDLHGIWWAQNDEEEEKLRNFVRLEREKMFPVMPLPKQCMVVERRNSIGGPQHGRYAAENLKNIALRQGTNAGMYNMPPMGPMGDMNPYQQPNMHPQMPMPYQNMPSNGFYDSQYPQMPFYPNEMNPYQMNQGYQAPGYPPMPAQPMGPAPGFQNPMQPPQAPYPGVPMGAQLNQADPNQRPKIVIGGPDVSTETKPAETNSQADSVPRAQVAAPLGQAPYAPYPGAPMPPQAPYPGVPLSAPVNPVDMYARPKIVIGGPEAPHEMKPAGVQPDFMPGGYAAALPPQPQQGMYAGFPNMFPRVPFEQNSRPKIVISPPMPDTPNTLAGPDRQSTTSSQTEPSTVMPQNSEAPLNDASESADTKKQMLNLCLNPTGATEESKSGDESTTVLSLDEASDFHN